MKPGTRILLVEDDPSISRLLQLELEHRGLTVRTVFDGPAALPAIEEFAPQAIVLDILLRDRHGLDVLPALRAAAPTARIVILTNAPHYRRRCLELGADLVLDKSADFDAVPAALRAV